MCGCWSQWSIILWVSGKRIYTRLRLDNDQYIAGHITQNSIFFILFLRCQINHVELSPNYAGTLMGLTGAVANTAGFISPYIVGIIVEDQVRIT